MAGSDGGNDNDFVLSAMWRERTAAAELGAFAIFTDDGTARYVSFDFAAAVGKSRTELRGRRAGELLTPLIPDFDLDLVRRCLAQAGLTQVTYEVARRTAREPALDAVELRFALITDPHRDTQEVICVLGERGQEATPRVGLSQFLGAVLAATPDSVIVLDLATRRAIFRAGAQHPLGYTTRELDANSDIANIVHPDDLRHINEARPTTLSMKDGDAYYMRYRGLHRDGHWRWLSHHMTPFARDENGTVTEVLILLRDIDDAVKGEQSLRHAAHHDQLTGLTNRAALMTALTKALEAPDGDALPSAVLFIDLDGFKRINDEHGHAIGDQVLAIVAERLRAAVRPHDTVARIGGDEFVILLAPSDRQAADEPEDPDTIAVENARHTAQRVMQHLTEPITVDRLAHVITASIGIRTIKPGDTSEQILHDADADMYDAKARASRDTSRA